MPHRSLNTLVFAGFDTTTAATLISMMGDEGIPGDLRIFQGLNVEPWESSRTGLMIIGMNPTTDIARVSQLIQNRTTYWEVAVCIPTVLSYYSVALLAQGAVKVLVHPEEDLPSAKRELIALLRSLSQLHSDAFGLEVADLIQLYGEKRMAKTIRLTGPGCVGSVFLFNGLVVHAETMDEEEGMTAFRRLISLESPDVRVHKGCLTDKKTIGIPAMSALLEGSRQVDEAMRDGSPPHGVPVRNDHALPLDSMDIDMEPLRQEFRSSSPPPASAPKQFDPLQNLFGDEDMDLH
jgi:hypothetical protein